MENWQKLSQNYFQILTLSGAMIIIILTSALWGGAMVLGKLPVPGRPTIWVTVGQGPTALAVGTGGELLGHFYSHLSFLSSLSLSLGDGPI